MIIEHYDIERVRHRLARPYRFKGRQLDELQEMRIQLRASGADGRDYRAQGQSVQSVLWAAPQLFERVDVESGNDEMFALTQRALTLIEGRSMGDPAALTLELIERLSPGLEEPNLLLNALVGLDFALWDLAMQRAAAQSLGELAPSLAGEYVGRAVGIPVIDHGSTDEEMAKLHQSDLPLLKLKLGGTGQTGAALVAADRALVERCIAQRDGDGPRYLLDLNGRYGGLAELRELIAGFPLDALVALEEPFAEGREEALEDLPVAVFADEAVHRPEDIDRLARLGYRGLALKPVAKTLSLSLVLLERALAHGWQVYCADLTVSPHLGPWQRAFASRLPLLPGLSRAIYEANGPQFYADWDGMARSAAELVPDWLRAGEAEES